jgi:hypothetical protein
VLNGSVFAVRVINKAFMSNVILLSVMAPEKQGGMNF